MPLVSRDISVSIHSGGQELTPYGIETDEETNTAVGYIASTAGETFEIHVEDMNVPRVPIVITVYADGQHLRSTGVRPEGSPLIVIDMARISQASLAPMSFSKYDLVDDPAISNEDTQNLGSVHIKVYESKLIASSGPVKDPSQNEYAMADFSRVAETSKKAGGHRVVLNREKIIRSASGGSSVAGVDPTKTTPLGNFKFFYQPKELLIAKGIMPRPPPIRNENECQNNQKRSLPTSPISENSGASSSALPRKRSRLSERLSHTPSEQPEEDVKPQIDGLQDDERDQRIQDLEAELNTLRAAARGKSGKVKRERLPSPIRVGNADGEVIDLTGDD